jgi:2-dehydropantoate 2-reductase
VALVLPMACALYMAGGDIYRLARTRDALALMVRAIREGMRVLEALGVPLVPAGYRILKWLPEPLLVAVLERSLPSPRAELGLARHANAARDEMHQLANEFRALVHASGVTTPALDELYAYIDPQVQPAPDGQAALALNWREAFIWALALLAGILFLRRVLRVRILRMRSIRRGR